MQIVGNFVIVSCVVLMISIHLSVNKKKKQQPEQQIKVKQKQLKYIFDGLNTIVG